jgi:hypothetical protein
MTELITLEEDTSTDPVISLDQGEGAPLLPPEEAQTRAVKHHFALGRNSPGIQSILATLNQGQEHTLRTNAAEMDRVEKLQLKSDILQNYVKNRPGETEPVPGEFEFLRSLSLEELSDSSDILERKYAQWAVSAGFTADPNKRVEEAIKEDVDSLDKITDTAEGIISTQSLAQRILQDLGASAGLFDYLKMFVPTYENFQSRAIDAPDSNYDSSLLMGENRQEQLRDFWMRNTKDRHAYMLDLFEKAQSGKINPLIVQGFVGDVISYGNSQKTMANIGSVFDAGDAALTVGTLGGYAAVKSAVKGSLKVAEGLSTAAKTVKTGETVGKTVADEAAKAGTLRRNSIYGVYYDHDTNIGYTVDGQQFSIVKKDSIKSSKSGREVGARAIYRNEADNTSNHVIEINLNKLAQDFKDKAWTKPKVEGVDALPEDAFKTEQEWVDFVINHEVEHFSVRRQPNQSLAEFENLINKRALLKTNKGAFVRENVDPNTGVRTSEVVDDNAVNRARGVLDATIENASRSDFNTSEMAEALGDFESGAVEAILRDSRGAMSGTAIGFGRQISRLTKSFFDPSVLTSKAGRWSQAARKQFEDTMAGSRNLFLRALVSGEGAFSVTREQIEGAMPMLKAEMLKRFHTVNNGVLDAEWRVIYEADNIAERNIIEVPLGRPDGTLFENAMEARQVARDLYGLADGSYGEPIQKGTGYFIRVQRDIDVTDGKFRDLLIDSDNKSPESAAATYLQFLVSGNTYMSKANQANRILAAHQQSGIYSLLKEAAESVGDVTRAEHRQLDAFLAEYRDAEFNVGMPDYKRGYWMKSVDEFEASWKQMYGSYPSEKATTAYFTYKNAMDFQYLVMNIRNVRDKTRMGIVNVEFSVPVEQVTNGQAKRSMRGMNKPIEGRLVDKPVNDKRVLIIDDEKMEPIYVDMKRDGTSSLESYQANGYRYVQIINPGAMPMKGVTGTEDVVNYVLVRNVREAPLDMFQIPYSEGGHVAVNLQYSIKQPRLTKTPNGDKLYRGDRFVTAHSSEAEAKKWWERMEAARKMLVAGDLDGLKKYLPVYTPWKTVDEFRAQFEPRTPRFKGDTDIDPLFDKDTPFAYVADRQGVNDAAKTHLRDLYKGYFDDVLDTVDDETNLYRSIDKEYTGEKSPISYTIEGNEGVWNFSKARHINPMAVMQESLSTTARNLALDNVQTQFVETWIQESADLLDIPIEKLRQDPYEHLMNPKWNRYADPARLGVAKAKRLAAMQFLGLRNPTNKAMDLLRNKLLNTIYNKLGKGATEWVDDHMLPLIKDPSQYIRAAAFHPTMGFFNPTQILLQGMTLAHSIAITGNPARAGTALAGSIMMSMSRLTFNDDVIRGMAKKAAKLGWKQEEFIEAYRLIRDQRLHIVEGEVGTLDTVFGSKLFKGKAGEWLDKGTIFFKETERLIRLNAFNIAYREFRKANPTKVINNTDVGNMMIRYRNLSLNMVRDSNSFWQSGILSIPLQFQSFNARLMEQLLGNQLTKAERLRVFGMYSALYGLPVGIMAGTGIPFGEDIRQAALERGINVDDGVLGVLMNGMMSVGLESMTGTQFNVASRMGPPGFTIVKDFLQGDKTTLEVLGGPSYSIINGILGQAFPAIKDIASFDMNSLQHADFGQAFQGITSVSNATKLIYALRTGKFTNRRGELVGDMSSTEAWIMFTTGMLPQDIQDTYTKINSLKSLSAADMELDKEFKRYIGKAIQLPPDSPERKELVKKAYTFMVDRPDGQTKAARLIHEVMGGKTLEDNVNKRFLKKAPISQQGARIEAAQEEEQE